MLIEMLHRASGLSLGQLDHLAETASRRYKVYTIPKKGGGVRQIEQPSRAIKAIQRWITKVVLTGLPVHEGATAYRKGASIRENARSHLALDYTVRVDFQSFFPSFADRHVIRFLHDQFEAGHSNLSDTDIDFICKIVCRNGALTIGAPSSPTLTNAMMYDFDQSVYLWSLDNKLVYTRYADDIFISGNAPSLLRSAPSIIHNISSGFKYANLQINEKKTTFLSRKFRRSVTGLVLTPDYKISIGLDRKNKIKSDIYQYVSGRLPKEEESRVGGFISFIRDVEPTFYETLCRKYGAHNICLLEGRVVRKETTFGKARSLDL